MDMEVEDASPPPGDGGGTASAGALVAVVADAADARAAGDDAPCVSLGHDELRCVFAALLTVDVTGKSLGRCVRALPPAPVLAAARTTEVALVFCGAAHRACTRLLMPTPARARAGAWPWRWSGATRCVRRPGAAQQHAHTHAHARIFVAAAHEKRRQALYHGRACAPRAALPHAAARSRAVPSRCRRSVWFKLFRSLDPSGADASAAAAPPPAPGALPPGKDELADHDYYRRFVEQYCACAARASAQRRRVAAAAHQNTQTRNGPR
jgi:hypothetical protein